MLNNWVFAYKLPDLGYGVKFSKSVLKKLKEIDAKGFLIEVIREREILLRPVDNEGDMNLIVEGGLKKGQIKTSFNSKYLHHKMVEAKFFSANEILEDVYGYRSSMEWLDTENAFIVKLDK